MRDSRSLCPGSPFGNRPSTAFIPGRRVVVCLLLILLSVPTLLLAQNPAEYHGKVVSADGLPLAEITVKNLSAGTSTKTDSKGEFTITGKEGDKIQVSDPAYQSIEQKLGEDTNLDFTLEVSDLVLIGGLSRQAVQRIYTTVPSDLSVASTDAVYSPEITRIPVTSFRNTLSGRLAGLYATQSSGLPGSDGASLSVRGQTPIIIIDGVVTNLTTFDLEEIESITVLKDGLATAMLGVRGAHGAILVTTKKGKASNQQISFTAQTAVQQPLSFPKTLRAYDYARLRNEALRNDGVDSLNSGMYYSQAALDAYRTGSDPVNYPDVDYRDEVTKKSSMLSRYTLSASGGNRFARYFVSLEHVNQSGFFKTVDSNAYNTNNSFKSYVVRSNVDVNITPKLSGGIYLLGRILNSNEPGATTATILSNLFNTPANAYPLLNANGTFGGTMLYQDNVLAQTIASGYRQRYNRDILVNAHLQRALDEITPGLWIKLKGAYYSTLAEDINRSKSFAAFQQTGAGYVQYGNNGTQANGNGIAYQAKSNYQELSIGYDKTFHGNGVNALLLFNRDNSTDGSDLPYTIMGTSGRIAYHYKGKYIVEGAFGLNGSNRYPDDGNTKLGFFPSIGAGWNIDQEDFLKSLPLFTRLKLFASYGRNGWDSPGYFVYYPRFFDGSSAIFGTGASAVTSITEGTLPNPGITWEKADKMNIGLTGAILNNRLGFTFEYFNNKYSDLLMQRGRNSNTIGNNYPDENIGVNRYSGYEMQLGWHEAIQQFQYFISFNASSLNSKWIEMDEVNKPFGWMRYTGQAVGRPFGYVSEGLFQSQAEASSSPTTVGYTAHAGDIKYRDLNSDGVINQFDQTAIGRNGPLFFYGLSFGISWKGFDISALIQGVQNRELVVGGSSYWAFQSSGLGQAYHHNLNRWTPENAANATYPRLTYSYNSNNNAISSYWIRNGDYFRLKNAEIGYSLPASLIGRIKLKTVRVFANGYNLLTHASSELDGRDPESFGFGYPIQRLFNFGINVKF
jgi:TonB-linked SusC/RagA family outer membrane protein